MHIMYNNATRVLGLQRNIIIWINYEGSGRSKVGERLHLGVCSSILPYQFLPSSTVLDFRNQAMLGSFQVRQQIAENRLLLLQLTYNPR